MWSIKSAKSVRIMLLAVVVLAGVVGGRPARAESSRFHRLVATSPVQAVYAVVKPYFVPGYNFYTCSRQLPRHQVAAYVLCPITHRLRRRLQHPPAGMGGSLAFCHCQNPPRKVGVQQIDDNGRVAHVRARWDYGAESFTEIFVVLKRAGHWLVDNEYCSGTPHAGIFTRAGARPCH